MEDDLCRSVAFNAQSERDRIFGGLGLHPLFGILFALPLLAVKRFGVNTVGAFWFAYIMTRPFGASFADWFGRTPALGGLGVGTGKTSIILTMLIVIVVAYLAVTRKDSKETPN